MSEWVLAAAFVSGLIVGYWFGLGRHIHIEDRILREWRESRDD